MQVITDLKEAKAFVKNMAQSLSDITYWNEWCLLDVSTNPPLNWIKQAKISAILRADFADKDGSILWLEKNLLVAFKRCKDFDRDVLASTLSKTLGVEDLRLRYAEFASNASEVQDILTRLTYDDQRPSEPPSANYNFLKSLVPNVDELLREWHRGKHGRGDRKRPHLMVVDDDPFTLRLVRQSLESEYVVITAQNGAEAIAKHLQLMPDIIFLDIGLPDCDGLTLLNYMQQYDQESRIVMFSADDFLKTKVKALAGGAKGFLSKPFNLQGFQHHIAEWFSTRVHH